MKFVFQFTPVVIAAKLPQFVFLCVAVAFCHNVAAAQSRVASADAATSNSDGNGIKPLTTIETEMRANMRIKREKSLHEDNIERALEAASIGTELEAQFSRSQTLDREATKKLERMEKLVRRLRNQAGGDDDEVDGAGEFARLTLGEAFDALQKQAAMLRAEVQNTPRYVVSSDIIEQSNKLLDLIKMLRLNFRQ